MSAIKFYGIAADKVGARVVESFGHGWTRSDVPWRAFWLKSEYATLAEREARERVHVMAMTLGSLTGAIAAAILIHFGG